MNRKQFIRNIPIPIFLIIDILIISSFISLLNTSSFENQIQSDSIENGTLSYRGYRYYDIAADEVIFLKLSSNLDVRLCLMNNIEWMAFINFISAYGIDQVLRYSFGKVFEGRSSGYQYFKTYSWSNYYLVIINIDESQSICEFTIEIALDPPDWEGLIKFQEKLQVLIGYFVFLGIFFTLALFIHRSVLKSPKFKLWVSCDRCGYFFYRHRFSWDYCPSCGLLISTEKHDELKSQMFFSTIIVIFCISITILGVFLFSS